MKELSKQPDWISEAGQCERPGLTFDPCSTFSFYPSYPSPTRSSLVRSLGSLRVLFLALIFISFLFYRFHAVSGAVAVLSRHHTVALGNTYGKLISRVTDLFPLFFFSLSLPAPPFSLFALWLVNWCNGEQVFFDNRWNYITAYLWWHRWRRVEIIGKEKSLNK